VVRRFAKEIAQLRDLGFAEGLPIERFGHAHGVVARLECGRVGVAVEFIAPGCGSRYAVVPIDPEASAGGRVDSDAWSDIVKDLRRRMSPDDDDRWV
jgi:hypothetical protein